MKTLEWEDNKLKLIDQRRLPDELTYVYCDSYQDAIVAIKNAKNASTPLSISSSVSLKSPVQ